MDYEVFLISRMREQWLLTHENDDSVATGVARTARPITVGGTANWWLPHWLERILPQIRLE